MAVAILFLARNKDTLSDKRDHRRGDPVAVMPVDHAWGSGEDKSAWIAKYGNADKWPGNFFIIRVNGITLRRARRWLSRHTRPALAAEKEFNAPDVADRVIEVHRKRWRLNISELPPAVRADLVKNGSANVSFTALKPYFRHKVTNARIMA